MSANSLSVPFPIFNDTSGDPLDAGYIYVGAVNLDPETSPISVYFDEALTIPALQPIRTINGYPSNNGSPARVYVNENNYSITVKNKNGLQVYTSTSTTERISANIINGLYYSYVAEMVADTSIRLGQTVAVYDYAAGVNSGILFFKAVAAGTGTPDAGRYIDSVGVPAIQFQQNLPSVISVKMFGVVGVGDEIDGIQAAIKAAYDVGASHLVFNNNTTYSISGDLFFNGYPGSNGLETGLTVVANGATLKLTAATGAGHVIGIGRGSYVGEDENVELTGNLTWIGGTIDCNNFAGENGFGISRTKNIHIKSTTVKNGSFSPSIEGGRGFTTHAASRNVVIENCYVYNMGDGYHVSTLPDNRSDIDGVDLYTITNITQAAQAVITTSTTHNYIVGEFVYVSQVAGMTEINPSYTNKPRYEVVAVTANTATIDLNTSAYTAYTSGGIVVRTDELNYRNRAVSFINCVAEECDHSGFNGETASQPRTVDLLNHNVLVDGLTLVNCGANSTDRGIINGNNVSGLKMRNITVYNTSAFPVSDVIRGSFQNCRIDVDIDVHTARSIVNADLLSGDEPSINEFPYNTTFNSKFKLMVDARVALSGAVLQSADRAGSSIDFAYRNHYDVGLYGVEGGITQALMDTYIQNSQSFVEFTDYGNGQKVKGFSDNIDLTAPFSGEYAVAGSLHVTSSGRADIVADAGTGQNSRLAAYEAGSQNGYFEYRHANDRWYMNINGTDAYQFTANNIFSGTDVSRDLGSAGLRFKNTYQQGMVLIDGVTAPSTISGHAVLYVDSADGDLKVKFGDGVVKTIVTDV